MKEIVAVLSAGTEFKDGNWQLDYWSTTRCDVALKLWRLHSWHVILSGGVHRYNRNVQGIPSVASLMKDYMVSKEPSVGQRLVLEEDSSTTYEQLYNITKFVHSKKCDVGILSNCWHLPRISALLAYCPQLRYLVGEAKLFPVEAYMVTQDINNEVIESEVQGIKDILSGTYKF